MVRQKALLRILQHGDRHFWAIYRKVPEGFTGEIENLPGANSQGQTLDETQRNLQEAVALILCAEDVS